MKISALLTALLRRVRRWSDARKAARFLDPHELEKIHRHHHATLETVPSWMPAGLRENSLFQYGVPDEISQLINRDIGNGITYSDALVGLSRRLRKKPCYLEIGVSVGKNFLQVAASLEDADLVGFDLEEINPVLLAQFQNLGRTSWPAAAAVHGKIEASLTQLRPNGSNNRVRYLSADVFDDSSWERLKGSKFNLVFSDALHTPHALLAEHEMLCRHNLLDDEELIMLWDDLGGNLTPAFHEICRRLKERPQFARASSFIAPLKGWLGDNWGDHSVGFFISVHE